MPNCPKCGEYFSRRVVIDGVKKNMTNRTFCLSCSPFQSHNTRNLTRYAEDGSDKRECLSCGKTYTYRRHTSTTLSFCNPCYTKRIRAERNRMVLEYLGGKCCVCGYDKCKEALDVHHLDPSKKEFTISHNLALKWETLKKELDKCVLLCSNHHRELHAGLIELEAFRIDG